MKHELLIIGTALVLLTVPFSSAHHLSAGYEDTVGMTPTESPSDKSVSDEARAAGIESDCYETKGELTADDASQSATRDAFCGELLYAQGTQFEQASPVDQDLRGGIATFDVVPASRANVGFGTCIPFCPGDVLPVVGPATWDAIHTAGSSAGLTHGPGQADDEASTRRFQSFGALVNAPSAATVAQETSGAWEMNGWWLPGGAAGTVGGGAGTRDFIGFVEDSQGNRLGPDDLETIISNDPDLPSEASPTVCGMSPTVDPVDFVDSFVGLGSAGSACELPFEYVEPGSGEADFKDGYQNRCESPTYVCGAVGGGYWRSSGYLDVLDSDSAGSQDDHVIWHWVIGHAPSECQGSVEPGIDFDPGTTKPYLAHDLDVWTPITETRAEEPVSQDGAEDYASAIGGDAVGIATGAPDEAVSNLPPLPGPIDSAVESARDSAFVASKNDRVEPNNAQPVGDLRESSKQEINIPRALDDPCSVITSSETSETVDPWVNIVDGEAWQDYTAFFLDPIVGFYGNTAQHQDDDNSPGPHMYHTTGKIGIFTDKDSVDDSQNDDGHYQQLSDDEKYTAKAVTNQGAYPLLWDMWADDDAAPQDPQVDETGGCERVDDRPFSQVMQDAGYGINTGLVQAIYLREPTVWMDDLNGQVAPFPGGNNIYLQMSEGARDLYDANPDTDANPLDARVDALVAELKDYAASKGPTSEDSIGVFQPGEQMGLRHDWGSGQCTESTGGFGSSLTFLHDCSVDCSGDTIVTMYTFQVASSDGRLGDGSVIPIFSPDNEDHDFGANTQHTWYDVDPFDGDPARSDEECSKPRNDGSPTSDPSLEPTPYTNCNDRS